MSRNGSGTYSAPGSTWNPPVNGVTATASDWAALLADLAAALTQSVSQDGQTPITGNIPMGGNKLTGLANGSASADSVAYNQINLNVGQCRLTKSGVNLLLSPFNGNRLTINGIIYTIPSAGVTLAATGATPNTTYYIYAYMVGATMTLEFSATTHATDTTTGVEIKSGDATRTLVGMARAISGPAWSDTGIQRFVISWFNRRRISALYAFQAPQTTTSASYVELNATYRNEFLTWVSDPITLGFYGAMNNTTVGAFAQLAIGLDGTTPYDMTAINQTASATLALTSFGIQITDFATEGYHYQTGLGLAGGGTTSVYGAGTTAGRSVLTANVMG